MVTSTMNPSTFIDVHAFDGKLTKEFVPRLLVLLPEDEIAERVNGVISLLTKPEAKKCVALILSRSGNQDNANQLNAFDVFTETCLLIHDHPEKEDLIRLLDEQLSDCFNLGQCPQGRTTRLYQLYLVTKQLGPRGG